MRPYYEADGITIYNGDCRNAVSAMEANSVDAVVSDPPYGLSFMGKGWDHGVPGVDFWTAIAHVAKPGAHLLAFGGTRTFHRLTCAIEDAGWEIRDCIMWVYGTGFPKSHNLGDGRGTALKPAWEPIALARKPLIGTVAANVNGYGTGAINVDACRIGTHGGGTVCNNRGPDGACRGHKNSGQSTSGETVHGPDTDTGRWPANLIHDGSDEVLAGFPESKDVVAGVSRGAHHVTLHGLNGRESPWGGYGGGGSAARFFYCAKASRADREDGMPSTGKRANRHPTVKPTSLMRYLCRLVTPPGGVVLDPFMGSGSTGKAAMLEGLRFVGVDLDADYCRIAQARIAWAKANRGPEQMELAG